MSIVDADEDRCDVKRLVYDICNETKKADKDYYDLYLNDENINDGVSDTLLYFLKQLKLPELVSSFIANVVTSCLSKSPSRTLQLAIAVFLKKKAFIDALHLFGITPSYDEFKRFKSSAALHTSNEKIPKILSLNGNLIQGVGDNFDCTINSQNGLKQTHSMALILTQQETSLVPDTRCDKESK